MILVNREPISFTQFPDGTTSFRYDTGDACWFRIEWRYDGDHECMLLWYLVHHIRANKRQNIDIELISRTSLTPAWTGLKAGTRYSR